MTLKTSKRSSVPPFIVMDVMRAAHECEIAGHDVLHMEVGQPGTAAPQPILDAAKAALDDNRIGYTGAFGLPDLRARLSRHYLEYYGAEVPEERIIVTTGSSGAFVLSFLGVFDPGDKVALASPGYPAYAWSIGELAGEVGMSRSAFAGRFKTLVGEAPMQYLTRWRMHRAAYYLRTEKLNIPEVADRVGYESDATFAKAFKRFIGTSPAAYRRLEDVESLSQMN